MVVAAAAGTGGRQNFSVHGLSRANPHPGAGGADSLVQWRRAPRHRNPLRCQRDQLRLGHPPARPAQNRSGHARRVPDAAELFRADDPARRAAHLRLRLLVHCCDGNPLLPPLQRSALGRRVGGAGPVHLDHCDCMWRGGRVLHRGWHRSFARAHYSARGEHLLFADPRVFSVGRFSAHNELDSEFVRSRVPWLSGGVGSGSLLPRGPGRAVAAGHRLANSHADTGIPPGIVTRVRQAQTGAMGWSGDGFEPRGVRGRGNHRDRDERRVGR